MTEKELQYYYFNSKIGLFIQAFIIDFSLIYYCMYTSYSFYLLKKILVLENIPRRNIKKELDLKHKIMNNKKNFISAELYLDINSTL